MDGPPWSRFSSLVRREGTRGSRPGYPPGSDSDERGAGSGAARSGLRANQTRVATEATTTPTLAHWLPVRPNSQVLSIRRKSVTMRPAAYHVVKVSHST